MTGGRGPGVPAARQRSGGEAASELESGARLTACGKGQKAHHKKDKDGKRRQRYSDREASFVWEHPDWTARDIAERLPGRTESSVRRFRERHGRWRPTDLSTLCVACDERPVWLESGRALRLRLCKDCYLREMELRDAEGLRANALRQRVHKARRRGR